jgi:ATP-dependent RNA helicase DDX46/PRP5
LQDSDDEDLEHDIDQQIENMLAPKRTVKEIKAPIGMNPGAPGTLIINDSIEQRPPLWSSGQSS